jgi:hypothetical protein
MKKLLKLTIIVAIVLLAYSGEFKIQAHDSVEHSEESSQTTDTSSEDKAKQLKQRLEERHKLIRDQISQSHLTRIQNRCKSSQIVIAKRGNQVSKIRNNRQQKYDVLITRLTTLADKLKGKGLDVTNLESQITVLSSKINSFKTDVSNYHQALGDLSEMSCQLDVDLFHSSLVYARKLHKDLQTSSADINDNLKNEIKPTLLELRKSLAKIKTAPNTTE